jgi:hypothetical protein
MVKEVVEHRGVFDFQGMPTEMLEAVVIDLAQLVDQMLQKARMIATAATVSERAKRFGKILAVAVKMIAVMILGGNSDPHVETPKNSGVEENRRRS